MTGYNLSVRTWARRVFALDARSLALFRMLLGGIVLGDLAIRAADFGAMYTEDGILPVASVATNPWTWSLHLLSGSAVWQAVLFGAAGICGIALLLGYRTRLATVLCWILLVSLHGRMPLVLTAADSYLRMLLLWSMFLPLGEIWSFDARVRRHGSRVPGEPVLSMASVAVVLQLCIVYWYAGCAKLNRVWLAGDAMDHILRWSMYVKPFGDWLLAYPDLLQWVTTGTVVLELSVPCLLFVPSRTGRFRLAVIASFVAFHLGIHLTLNVGLFAFVAFAGLSVLLPAGFWVVAARVVRLDPETGASRERYRDHAASRGSRLRDGLCLFFLAYIVGSWDFSTLRYRDMPEWLEPVGKVMMLPQAWGMFQTAIPRDYWYVYRGQQLNGEVVDALQEGVLTEIAAVRRSDAFPNHRWRKLHARLVDADYSQYRQAVVDHLLEMWNSSHKGGERIAVLEMYAFTMEVGREAESDKVGVAPFARAMAAEKGRSPNRSANPE